MACKKIVHAKYTINRGSDPSSGAGIQGDIKSCESLNAYCLTVITGITSQNTTKLAQSSCITQDVKEQLDMMSSDFKIDGIKMDGLQPWYSQNYF